MITLRNSVQLIGHLGADPVVKHFENGRSMAKLRLATNEYYTDKDGKKQENVQWHSIVVWGNLANFVESYVKKGSKVVVEGKLTYRTYDDPKGHKKHFTEIVASEILHLSEKLKEAA